MRSRGGGEPERSPGWRSEGRGRDLATRLPGKDRPAVPSLLGLRGCFEKKKKSSSPCSICLPTHWKGIHGRMEMTPDNQASGDMQLVFQAWEWARRRRQGNKGEKHILKTQTRWLGHHQPTNQLNLQSLWVIPPNLDFCPHPCNSPLKKNQKTFQNQGHQGRTPPTSLKSQMSSHLFEVNWALLPAPYFSALGH